MSDSIPKYINDTEVSQIGFKAFLLLGLLANYNKFEVRNPYKTRMEDFVNESTISKIVHGFGATCIISRDRYVSVQEDTAEGWTFGTALSYVGLGKLASNKASKPTPPKVEDLREIFANL